MSEGTTDAPGTLKSLRLRPKSKPSKEGDAGAEPLSGGPKTSGATLCPIAKQPGSGSAVWPEIPDHADILNLGFAPGRDEVDRPFTGASGQLLRRWLRQAGLYDRSAFFNVEMHRTFDLVCRVCGVDWALLQGKLDEALHRPKQTKTTQALIAKWHDALDGHEHQWREVHANREPKDPKTGECCGLPVIARLLSQERWKIVLCWGAVPARLVGGYKGSVGAMVGRFRTLGTGQTCTALYHPAYALRLQGSSGYSAVEGLEREVLHQVRDRLDNPGGKDHYPFILHESPSALVGLRSVVDLESRTLGAAPDPRTDPPHTLCVGELGSQDVALARIDEHSKIDIPHGAQLITHNAQFDLPMLFKLTGREDFTADDTMVMAYLLGEPTLSLKILARRLLGRDAREYKETDGDDDEYAAQDPHLTRDLYDYFRPQIDARGLAFLYDEVKTPLQRIMARHVVKGLRIDHGRLSTLHEKIIARQARLREMLVHEVPGINPSSLPQVEHYIYDVLGVPPDRKLGRTTNETYIGQFRYIPFISTLLAYRKATAFQSRYTTPLGALDRVSGLYDLTGTGTDRVSQARRNCMNFPLLVKQCIEADEGGYFVYGDYSQVELRLAAYFSRDPYLLGVLREGRNMHEELCIAVYGVRTPDTYTQAKSSNFAKLFGAGVNRRARTLKMPVSVVRHNEIPWPGWDRWVEQRKLEPARTYWGYERNIDDHIESDDEYLREKANRETINSIIQGTAGEITQYAMVLADANLMELGGFVIHQEHDSVLGWVPNRVNPDEAMLALSSAMRAAVPQEILDVIDVKAKVIHGTHWG